MTPDEDITEEELTSIYESAWDGDALSDDELMALVEEFNNQE